MSDEQLNKVLGHWTVKASLSPQFPEQVWRRIARQEAEQPASFFSLLRGAIEAAVPRPRFVLSYAAAALAIGMLAGTLTAQTRTSRLESRLSAQYVQSVNPYHRSAGMEP